MFVNDLPSMSLQYQWKREKNRDQLPKMTEAGFSDWGVWLDWEEENFDVSLSSCSFLYT